jgi:hypothetical protein
MLKELDIALKALFKGYNIYILLNFDFLWRHYELLNIWDS